MITKFIAFCALNHPVKNQNAAVCFTKDEWKVNVIADMLRVSWTYVSRILMSWKSDLSSWTTDFTFSEKHWPGHNCSLISLNQPFTTEFIFALSFSVLTRWSTERNWVLIVLKRWWTDSLSAENAINSLRLTQNTSIKIILNIKCGRP